MSKDKKTGFFSFFRSKNKVLNSNLTREKKKKHLLLTKTKK